MRGYLLAGICGLLSFSLCTAGDMAKELPSGEKFVNSIVMEFVRIERGTFRMGGGDPLPAGIVNKAGQVNGDFDELPNRQVTISRPFYMGVCEVTNQQYEQFDPIHKQLRGKVGFAKEDDEAVVFVDWHEAARFCEWLSQREGLPYRLPTEAEWEYACRAGTTTQFNVGDELGPEYLIRAGETWYPDAEHEDENAQTVLPLKVKQTAPNAWGLYDMHGNVEEWCHDWYGPYDPADVVDPVGRAEGTFRVTRGGSHSTEIYYLRSVNRSAAIPEDKHWLIGFRVVLGPMPDTKPLPPPLPELCQRDVKQEQPADLAKGPDPNVPYFEGPRKYVKIPAGSMGPLFAHHNHDPALVECPNGDLLAIWYTCVGERGRELATAASRLRYGETEWEDASPFWAVPDRNNHAPAMWYDGQQTIYHFQGLSVAATWGPLAVIMRTSADSGATWSYPALIMPEHRMRHQCVESVFRMQDGTIVLPCDAVSAGEGGTAIHLSEDEGVSWNDAGGTINGIHAGVVELADGRLMALGRGDSIDGRMPMSISGDKGARWTYKASPFPPIGSGQRLVLTRLQEGPILLVSYARDPLPITDASGNERTITGMYAALSYDDGETWSIRRPISDDGPGRQVECTDGQLFTMSWESAEPKGYLSITQAPSGVIHLISSRQHYAFNLAWLEADPPAGPVE